MLNDLETLRAITGAGKASTSGRKTARLPSHAGQRTTPSRGGLFGGALRCLDIYWREWVSERHTRRIRLRHRQS